MASCCAIKYLALLEPIFLVTNNMAVTPRSTITNSGMLMYSMETDRVISTITVEISCGKLCEMSCLSASISFV